MMEFKFLMILSITFGFLIGIVISYVSFQIVYYYLYSTIRWFISFLWHKYGSNTISEEDTKMGMEFISYIKSYWASIVTFLLQSECNITFHWSSRNFIISILQISFALLDGVRPIWSWTLTFAPPTSTKSLTSSL